MSICEENDVRMHCTLWSTTTTSVPNQNCMNAWSVIDRMGDRLHVIDSIRSIDRSRSWSVIYLIEQQLLCRIYKIYKEMRKWKISSSWRTLSFSVGGSSSQAVLRIITLCELIRKGVTERSRLYLNRISSIVSCTHCLFQRQISFKIVRTSTGQPSCAW